MVALYTVIVGGVTIGGVYVLFHSGLYMVIIAAIGLFLAGFGGAWGGRGSAATVGGASASVEEHTYEKVSEQMAGGYAGLAPSTNASVARIVLILYGIGLVFWSILVLTFFRSGLH